MKSQPSGGMFLRSLRKGQGTEVLAREAGCSQLPVVHGMLDHTRHAHVLISRTCECYLIGKKDLC